MLIIIFFGHPTCTFQILPVNIKGLAGSIATLANWLTSWAITMTANLLLTWSSGGMHFCVCMCMCVSCFYWYDSFITTGTFTIYTLVSAFTVVFVSLWVPETKGRTLEEIQSSFRWTLLLKHVFILNWFWSKYHAESVTCRCKDHLRIFSPTILYVIYRVSRLDNSLSAVALWSWI